MTRKDDICLLCLEKAQNSLNIIEDSFKELTKIGTILLKHFWFKNNQTDLFSKRICSKCWLIVGNFNDFYESVKQNHDNNKLSLVIRSDQSEIKSEIQEEKIKDEELASGDEMFVECLNVTGSYDQLSDHEDDFNHSDAHYDESPSDDGEYKPKALKKTPIVRKGKVGKVKKSIKNKPPPLNDVQITVDGDEVVKDEEKKANNVAEKIEKLIRIQKFFNMHCDLCSSPLVKFTDVKNHFRMVHNQNGYLKCCDTKAYRMSQALEHCEWHENPDKFKCKFCNKSFCKSNILSTHITSVHATAEERKFKCTECHRAYAREHFLKSHMRKSHVKEEDKMFECHICKKRFSILFALKQHIDKVHENRYSHICETCAKPLRSAKQLEMHFLTEHTNIDQRVQCNLCGKWLKHTERLKRHLRHHEQPTATCPICGRISTNRKALNKHIKIAHMPATLQCTICDKMFKKRDALKEHVAVHTGVDLYTCSFCPKTFRSNGNMSKHRKQMHPIEYAESKANGSIK